VSAAYRSTSHSPGTKSTYPAEVANSTSSLEALFSPRVQVEVNVGSKGRDYRDIEIEFESNL